MKARRLGYARVSTKEHVVDRQVKLLKEAGVSEDDIYIDKITRRTLNREKWKELYNIVNRNTVTKLLIHHEGTIETLRKVINFIDELENRKKN